MTTEICTKYNIADLLPHENILNFHVGVPVLPSWVEGSLTLMIGAGDLDQDGIPNVKAFPTFDVYACYPWDNAGSLRENMTEFLKMPKKLLCFLDFTKQEHLDLFANLFKGKFRVIEGHGAHSPHLKAVDLSFLLEEGGQASNIFERSANVSSVSMVKKWLKNPHISYIGNGHIFDVDESGIYKAVSSETKRELTAMYRDAIRNVNCTNMQIHVEEDYLHMINTWEFEECQSVLTGLLHDFETPVNMRGTVKPFQAAWDIKLRPELIYTKTTPNFYPEVLEKYIAIHGMDSQVIRQNTIRDRIYQDIEQKCIFPGKAKYNTYRREFTKIKIDGPASAV